MGKSMNTLLEVLGTVSYLKISSQQQTKQTPEKQNGLKVCMARSSFVYSVIHILCALCSCLSHVAYELSLYTPDSGF